MSEALPILLRYMTADQLMILAQQIEIAAGNGWGVIEIHIEKGQVRKWCRSQSGLFPPPSPTEKKNET